FELLKKRKAIYFETEGKNKGCWVMPGAAFSEHAEEGDEDLDKIIVRSNGTVTYVGKDIAYQLWKMGLLGTDFRYHPFHTYPPRDDGEQGEPAKILWSTTTGEDSPVHPHFGAGASVYNVIDVRQSYLQRVVQQGLRALGHDDAADRSHHFAYEMVALSPACARKLGLAVSEEDEGKTHVEMSGRRG